MLAAQKLLIFKATDFIKSNADRCYLDKQLDTTESNIVLFCVKIIMALIMKEGYELQF